MSRRALLEAVRNALRSELHFSEAECEITDQTGRPPPRCGKRFIAVHRGGRIGRTQVALDEMYDVMVTVTLRINEPFDRKGANLVELTETGMDDLCDRIRALIGKDSLFNGICNAANAILKIDESDPSSPRGFREGLYFVDDNGIRDVGGDWFHAMPDAIEVGLVTAMRFTGARRIQYLEQAL